ncbi:MAG: hypothetical protein LBC45_01555 [Chlamydiales bacterium]|nr:hypothetical protein [Chlamydiales bacterium]
MQGSSSILVHRMIRCYCNIVGLSIHAVKELLSKM